MKVKLFEANRDIFRVSFAGVAAWFITNALNAYGGTLVSNAVFDNWDGIDCPGGMFSGFNFSGDNFGNNDFSGADFSLADLTFVSGFGLVRITDASFANADLSSAVFSGLEMAGADFSSANLTNTDLSFSYDFSSANPTIFDGAIADGLKLTGSDFSSGISAIGGSFIDADFSGVTAFTPGNDFSDSDFSNSDFTDSIIGDPGIGGANFSGATLINTDFTFANTFYSPDPVNFEFATADGLILYAGNFTNEVSFHGATLIGAILKDATFFGTYNDWSDADFSSADLTNVVAIELDLSGANFTGATLTGADFSLSQTNLNSNGLLFNGATADYLQFSGSSVSGDVIAIGASFIEADFTDTLFSGILGDFSDTDFTRSTLVNVYWPLITRFHNTDLTDCDMNNANFDAVDFTGATLRNTNLSQFQIFGGGGIISFDSVSADHLDFRMANVTKRVTGIGGIFTNADFTDGVFAGDEVDFTNADFTLAQLVHISWASTLTRFVNANLTGCNMNSSSIGGADFTGATMTNTDLSLSNTQNSPELIALNLVSADGLKFMSSDITNDVHGLAAVFTNADFTGTIFAGNVVDFTDADFSQAHLVSVTLATDVSRFRNANLTGCDMNSSEIGGADFTGATLTNANLNLATTHNSPGDVILDGVSADGLNLSFADLTTRVSGVSGIFTNANFSDSLFGGLDVDFSNADFSNSQLSNMSLPTVASQFVNANLTDCNFSGSLIGGANFTNATLTNADFSNVRTENSSNSIIFDQALAPGLNLSSAFIGNSVSAYRTEFSGADFRNATFTSPTLEFQEANFSNVLFDGAVMNGAIFDDARLSGSNISNAQLVAAASIDGINLDLNNLSGFDLKAEVIPSGSFESTVLDGADFSNADLQNTNFRNAQANVSGVVFDGANLSGADFSGASFLGGPPAALNKRSGRGASDGGSGGFSAAGANLSGAKFKGANLNSANFTGATVSGADFRGTKLINAAGLAGAVYTVTPVYDETTDFSGTGVDPLTEGWQYFEVPTFTINRLEAPEYAVVIMWPGIDGLSYDVQVSNNFSSWTTIGSGIPGAVSNSHTHETTGIQPTRSFYRVIVSVP